LGFRFYYWSQEHKPIHIHVRKGDAESRFAIESQVELTENHGLKPHELALAEEIICDNQEFMIEHWNLYFKNTQQ
jgi:hypothetical protein